MLPLKPLSLTKSISEDVSRSYVRAESVCTRSTAAVFIIYRFCPQMSYYENFSAHPSSLPDNRHLLARASIQLCQIFDPVSSETGMPGCTIFMVVDIQKLLQSFLGHSFSCLYKFAFVFYSNCRRRQESDSEICVCPERSKDLAFRPTRASLHTCRRSSCRYYGYLIQRRLPSEERKTRVCRIL